MDREEERQANERQAQEDGLRGIVNPGLLNILEKLNKQLSGLKEARENLEAKSSVGSLLSVRLFGPAFPSNINTRYYSELKVLDKNIEELEKLHDELENKYDSQQLGREDNDDEKEIVDDDDEKVFEYEPWD